MVAVTAAATGVVVVLGTTFMDVGVGPKLSAVPICDTSMTVVTLCLVTVTRDAGSETVVRDETVSLDNVPTLLSYVDEDKVAVVALLKGSRLWLNVGKEVS